MYNKQHAISLRIFGAVALFLIATSMLSAQSTPLETLENAYKNYDRISLFNRSLSPKTTTASDLAKVKQETDENIVLLTPIALSGVDSIAIPAKYYRLLTQYEYASTLALKGEKEQAFAAFSALDTTMNGYTIDRFPIVFTVVDRKYSAYFSDFEPFLAIFNANLAGYYYEKSDFANALPYARKAQLTGMLEESDNAVNYYRIVQMKTQNKEYDRELIESAIATMESYQDLTTVEKDLADAKGMKDGMNTCANVIATAQKENAELAQGGEYWARLSRIYVLQKNDAKAVETAILAMDNGFSEREYLLAIIPIAVKVNDKKTAKRALDIYANSLGSSECSALRTAADQYTKLEETTTAAIYEKRSATCEKKNDRGPVAGNKRKGGLYLGTYVYPWFRTDWGAVMGIQTKKAYIEFSYQELSDRRDKLYDLRLRGADGASDLKVRWDGYYTHLAINKNKGKYTYNGVLFGYNQRNFQTIQVPVITENGVQTNTSPVNFRPKEERYILMFNSGSHIHGKVLAFNSFFSFGGAWSTFERGVDPTFDREGLVYSNTLLDNRKETRFSLMVRFGFTIGLHFGPRTFGK